VNGEFRYLGEEPIFDGYIIKVANGRFAAPDGTVFERDIVRHPGAVSVVPYHGDGTVTMVRQYRAALDMLLLEIPAGKRDVADEEPVLTAHRELAEEVGLRAGRMVPLVEFVNSAGFTDEYSHVFLGTELSVVERDVQGIEEENLTVERINLDDVPAMIADHRLLDIKSIIGLTMLISRLGAGGV
jgi:ADP-ribose pyrophosphatase